MGCIETLCDLNAQIEDGFQLHRTATDTVLESHAVHKFHGDESPSTFLADFVNRFKRQIVFREFFWQELQCHKAAQLYVLGFVNHTHPTATELFKYAVVRDCLPNHGREDSLCDGC